jgi:predicted small secreted protein
MTVKLFIAGLIIGLVSGIIVGISIRMMYEAWKNLKRMKEGK